MIICRSGSLNERFSNEQLDIMAKIYAEAFSTHENWIYVIKKSSKRKNVLFSLFRFLNGVINDYGYFVEKEEEGKSIGYITFMKNSDLEQISFKRILKTKSLKYLIKFIFSLNPRELIKMIQYLKALTNFYKTHEHDLCGVHLYNTAIKPEFKGQGHFKEMLSNSETFLAKQGFTSLFLETTDTHNIGLYEHLGFNVIGRNRIGTQNRYLYFLSKDITC